MFGILQSVSDADDAVGIGDIHFRVLHVGDEIDMPAADRLGIKADVLVNDLDIRLFPCRGVLEGARTDGAHLGAQNRNGDNCHDLAADGRLNELNVPGLGVVLQLHGVGGASGIQLHRKARGEVAAVDCAAHKNSGGIVLAGEHCEGIGIGVGVEVFIAPSADADQAVDTAVFYLFRLTLGEISEDHGIEPVAGGVAELSQFAA